MGSHAERVAKTEQQRVWCGCKGKEAFVVNACAVLRVGPYWLDELRRSDVVKVLVRVVPERDESLAHWCDRAVAHWREEAQRALA